MTLLQQLMGIKRQNQAKALATTIAADPESVKELMDCFFNENMRISQKCVTVLGMLASKNSKMLNPYLQKMIRAQANPIHSGIRRNIMRTFTFMDIPEKFRGEIFEAAMHYVNDTKEAIAVRAFSISIIGRMCHYYPELKDEVIHTISMHEEHGSPGFRAHAKKIKKLLAK